MALTINTNVSALIAQKNMNATQEKLAGTLNRLSSGTRINNAKDDAAGNAIAQGMDSRIRALTQGARNGNDGISLVQTAESGVNQSISLLQRMRELASQASTGTYGATDIANIDVEFQALKAEIDRVQSTTEFNGISVLSGGDIDIQVGSQNSADDRLTITLATSDTASLGVDADDLTTQENAQNALDSLESAITTLTTASATLGASHSNIEAAVNNNVDRVSKLGAAKSQIMDTDYAQESSNLAQYQIMQQAGAAMLAQANSSGQIALSLLQ